MVYTKLFQRCKGSMTACTDPKVCTDRQAYVNPLTAGAAYIRVFIFY